MDDVKIKKQNPKYIRLSYTLREDSPVHIGLNKLKIKPVNRIDQGNNYNTSLIIAENHCGTHIDAPAHFILGGRYISDYSPEELIFFHPFVLNCPKKPGELVDIQDVSRIHDKTMDCLIINTGFYQYHDSDLKLYLEENPGLSPEAVNYLRENFPEIRMVGIDSVSMSRYGHAAEAIAVHQNAFKENDNFGKPLLFVEDMDLSLINDNSEIKEVIVVPWQVGDLDGAPCTVLAKIR